MIEVQKASDKMYFELEEKCMSLEDAQHEREMKIRRDEQELQYRFLKCCQDMPHPCSMEFQHRITMIIHKHKPKPKHY